MSFGIFTFQLTTTAKPTKMISSLTWVMEHMGDADFNSPFQPAGAAAPKKSKGPPADEEAIAMVMSMGFTREQAEMGLRNTENNMEQAVDWIFR